MVRIAVIGSGVSGIAAVWALNEHSSHEVNLYESGDYPGGHTHTVRFKRDGKEPVDVDTGFIVCNPPTYPNFLAFLKQKGVQTLETVMTFAVSRDRGDFEWAGKGLRTVFVQGRNIFNPRIYRMLFDVFRFNLFGLDLVAGDQDPQRVAHTSQEKTDDVDEFGEGELSIGEYLERERFGKGFIEDYLLPMTAAIWSTPADKCALDFPAKTLIRFFHNHHLMQVDGRPKWLTVAGGAKHYVEAVLRDLKREHLHLNCPIVAVTPHDNGVTLREASGAVHEYDYVVMATHSDTSLQLLRAGGGATADEESILGAFEWSQNEAVLHWDERFMPVRRKAWSAWNYLTSSDAPASKRTEAPSAVNTVSLTYDMNQLQSLDSSRHGPVLVTLNPPHEVDPRKVVGRYQYEHPMYSAASVRAQKQLSRIQNARRITFAGAWTNYGFHEDGFTSGCKVAVDHFGASLPFPIRPADRAIRKEPLARAAVSALEVARRAVFDTRLGVSLWASASWCIVVVCVWLAQVAERCRAPRLAKEIRGVQAAWQ